MQKMNLEQIMEAMERETGNYGFRGASKRDLEILKDGEYLDASLDLWDERNCDYQDGAERLNGTSAIGINEYMGIDEVKKWYDYAKGYADNHHKTGVVLFVYGDNSDCGDDDHEIVLKCDFESGAKVIAEVSF